MHVFAVHLSGDPTEQSGRLRDVVPEGQHYQVSERLYFVRSDTTARSLAETLGLRGAESQATGAVLKLNGEYSGFEKQAMWNWLSERLQEGE